MDTEATDSSESCSTKAQDTHILHEVLFALIGFKSAFASQQYVTRQLFQASEALLLEKVLKLGEKYYELKKFIDEMQKNQLSDSSPNGVYLLSFVEHLEQVLEPYCHDIVELEQEIIDTPEYSLQNVWSKIHKYSDLLFNLHSLVNEIQHQNSRGCMLLQHLHQRLSADVGIVRTALKFIIQGINKVLFCHISNWLLYGELIDRKGEFFIKKVTDSEKSEGTPFEEYVLNTEMLPDYLEIHLAEKILNVGQTVLFLRSNPNSVNYHDSDKKSELWIDDSGIFDEKEKSLQEKIARIQTVAKWNENGLVERLISEVSSCVTLQLWTLAVQDARLVEQLRLVKEIFLLGRGELFHEFIAQTDSHLHGGSGRNLELNQVLQECARKVLMKEECLQRFTLDLKSDHCEKGKHEKCESAWNRLRVKYDVPWPLQLLFTPTVLNSYNRIFRFLIRLKRIQVKLVDCWLTEKAKKKGEASFKRRELHRNLWFLVNNLQYYLHVDVLDSQFMIFETTIENSKHFDEIQKAHVIFLNNLLSQLFIQESENEKDVTNPVQRIMNKIIELCEDYCRFVEIHGDVVVEEKISGMLLKFEACVEFLLKLIAGLSKQASHPCSQYLSQFLLRLDFNSYFSNHFSSNLITPFA